MKSAESARRATSAGSAQRARQAGELPAQQHPHKDEHARPADPVRDYLQRRHRAQPVQVEREEPPDRECGHARGESATGKLVLLHRRALSQASRNTPGERSKTCGIRGIEAVKVRAVDVEHAQQLVVRYERDHDFRARGRIAGDVARESVHVRHHQSARARARRRAAHAVAERDAHAGGLALERADHELAAL